MLSLALSSCNSGKIKELELKNAELERANSQQDSLMNSYFGFVNEFQNNLDAINQREGLITSNSTDPEMQGDEKQRILDNIQQINTLLDRNRRMIDSLTQRMGGVQGKNRELSRTIERLSKQLADKDGEIATLKSDLERLNFNVAELNRQVDVLKTERASLENQTAQQSQTISQQSGQLQQQKEEIEAQTIALNTAYYIAGTTRELKDKNILAKAQRMEKDFDASQFVRVDIRNLSEIVLNVKKATVMTSHPTDSYRIEGVKTSDKLVITNPSRFWSASKFLVIKTD